MLNMTFSLIDPLGELGREDGAASGLHQPGGARGQGGVGGGAVETGAGVAGADHGAAQGNVSGRGGGQRTVVAWAMGTADAPLCSGS